MSAVHFAEHIVKLLLRIALFQQSIDEDGRIISPIPQAKQASLTYPAGKTGQFHLSRRQNSKAIQFLSISLAAFRVATAILCGNMPLTVCVCFVLARLPVRGLDLVAL